VSVATSLATLSCFVWGSSSSGVKDFILRVAKRESKICNVKELKINPSPYIPMFFHHVAFTHL